MTQNVQRGPFLFINKDGESRSLFRSTGESAALIRRHVQQRRRERDRNQKIRATPKSSHDAIRAVHQNWDLMEEKRMVSASNRDGLNKRNRRIPKPNPNPKLRLNFFDPFGCTAINLNTTHSVLAFSLTGSIIAQFRAEMFGEQVLMQIVRESISSPMHMYALLTAAVLRTNSIPGSYQQSGHQFMQPAIRLLREFLQTCTKETNIDSLVIFDILCLCLAERFRQNYDASLLHLQVVRHLADRLDFTRIRDRYIYEFACVSDTFLALEMASVPLFTLLLDSPSSMRRLVKPKDKLERELFLSSAKTSAGRGRNLPVNLNSRDQIDGDHKAEEVPAQKSSETGIRLSELGIADAQRCEGGGFAEALDAGFFGSPLDVFIADLVPWLALVQDVNLLPRSKDNFDRQWVAKGSTAFLRRLAFISNELLTSDTILRARSRERCCCLALMIIMCYYASPIVAHPLNSAAMNMMRLRSAFVPGPRRFWETETGNQLLLWILFTGLFAALGSPEEEFFMSSAADLASELNVYDHFELRRLVSRYIYHEIAQRRCLSRLAAQIRLRQDRLKILPLQPNQTQGT